MAIGYHPACASIPPSLTSGLELIVEPLEVPGARPATNTSDTEVRWKDLPAFEDSWEPANIIATQFPSFNFEDKVALWAAGNVRPPIKFTCTQRKEMKEKKSARLHLLVIFVRELFGSSFYGLLNGVAPWGKTGRIWVWIIPGEWRGTLEFPLCYFYFWLFPSRI